MDLGLFGAVVGGEDSVRSSEIFYGIDRNRFGKVDWGDGHDMYNTQGGEGPSGGLDPL